MLFDMENPKFYSQLHFEKWLNYLTWNLIIVLQKTIINLGYVEQKIATPTVKVWWKTWKKEL